MLSCLKLTSLSPEPLQLVARMLILRTQLQQDIAVYGQTHRSIWASTQAGNYPTRVSDNQGLTELRAGRMFSGVRSLTTAWPEHFISLNNLADNPGAAKTVRTRFWQINLARGECVRFPRRDAKSDGHKKLQLTSSSWRCVINSIPRFGSVSAHTGSAVVLPDHYGEKASRKSGAKICLEESVLGTKISCR